MTKASRPSGASEPEPARYPIRAVSRLTGLGIDTLRAWERRHNAVTPIRDDRGRMYTDADVERLRLLRDVVRQGHSIGRVAGLDAPALRRLAYTTDQTAAPGDAEVRRALTADLERLMAAVESYDSATLEAELGRAAALLPPSDLLEIVVLPLLTRVGDDWHDGRATIAQEHFVTTCVRSVLGAVLRTQPHYDTRSRLLLATPSGEHHELGTLGAALLASANGLGVLYLGSDLPADDIVSGATAAEVDAVVLGVTGTAPDDALVQSVGEVARRLPTDMELWIGGPAARRVATGVGARAICLSTYSDFAAQLARVGGRL